MAAFYLTLEMLVSPTISLKISFSSFYRGLSMFSTIRALFIDESAQSLVEYSFILSLVAMVCILAVTALGAKASNSLSNSANVLP